MSHTVTGETNQTANSVLAFKPNKMSEYSTGAGQGKCNLLQTSELDASFARMHAGSEPPPDEIVEIGFDALLLAEGEWSQTCKRLGVGKSVDRFTQAIGWLHRVTASVTYRYRPHYIGSQPPLRNRRSAW